ncbi:MAG: hypothetical protein ABL934_07830 [Lysobacteraceae bacterium]
MANKVNLLALLAVCALCGCAAQPFAAFEDPRPEGRLSLRERSRCEVPDAPSDQPNWCDYPHEVRAFLDRRDGCDHFRGEPIPEPVDDPGGERRREIETALRELCTGTDAELVRLRARYRDDAAISAALAGLEDDIEP